MTCRPRFFRGLWLVVMGFSLSLTAFGEEFVVKVKENFHLEDMESTLARITNVKVMDEHAAGQLILVKEPKGTSLASVQRQLSQLPGVEYVVPNVKFHIVASPNDTLFAQQWALQKIGAEKAWSQETNTQPVVVAVIDTGIDYKHEDLKDQILRDAKGDMVGWNFFDNNNDPIDVTSTQNPGHGTHCAGIVSASVNNGVGVAGIARHVKIMPLRFIGADGSGDLMNAIKAIDYAITNNANIISASWGATIGRDQVKPLIDAIDRANQKGVIFVAAAANDGKSNDKTEVFPANAGLPNMISVAASDNNDQKPSWSNYGRATVDLAAPGAAILSTLPNNKYDKLSGTSMATPLVAGLTAVLLGQAKSQGKNYTAAEIKSIMQASGEVVKIETACNCRISADNAVAAIVENKLVVVPNALTLKSGDQNTFHSIGGHAPFTYTSSNTAAATIGADGVLKAVADGTTTITVKDSDGHEATSRDIIVAKPGSGGGGDGGGGDGGGGGGGDMKCPLPDAQMCQILCMIIPNMPWCKKISDDDFLNSL